MKPIAGQSEELVNYAKRYDDGLRIGTAAAEGAANSLSNGPMNKSQQMRWSRRGANLLLQVRCAVYNGAFGAESARLFHLSSSSPRNWQKPLGPDLWTIPQGGALPEAGLLTRLGAQPRLATNSDREADRMTGAIWVEVALNGPWGRSRQPGIPVAACEIIEQAIACAQAGAAIVHFHVYDEATGMQKDDWETYARVIEGIRARTDVIAYPTIPLAGSSFTGQADSAHARYGHLDELGRRGLVEWGVIDPGSVNFTRYDAEQRQEAGFVYLNPDEHIEEGLRVCAEHRLHPSFAIYEPGFARLGALLAGKHRDLPSPIYRLMFSDEYAWGFPPKDYALDAYISLLREVAPAAPWMIAGLSVDVTPLMRRAAAAGGHVRVGLEDAHFGCKQTNTELVEEAVKLIAASGAQPASPGAVRGALSAHAANSCP